MEIYLIRHTKPDILANICYGQSDIDVASSFSQELASIRKHFQIDDTFIIFSSPLKRCRILAEALSLSSPIHTDNRLKELNFGDWELKRWDDMDQNILSEWGDNFVTMPVPGGESCREMYDRSISFFKELCAEYKEAKKVAVVTHGGVIRSMLVYALGIPLENMFRLAVDYGSISKIEINLDFITVKFFNLSD